MVHLTNTSRSATFLLGTAMLMLFFFCAPVHAQMIPFQSTSNRPVISQPISNSINGSSNSNIVGEYKPYHPNVYVPFGDETPSSGNPLNNNGSGGSGDPNDDVGIPGWADTPSEPLPIGDTAPLFWLAAAMIAIIAIRQRRKQLQTQSINTSNNNDNSDSMHTTRHISSNRLQKLFLLLALVCFVGQVSGQTVYKTTKMSTKTPTNFPKGGYGYQGAYANNLFYAARYMGEKIIYSISENTVTQNTVGHTTGYGTCCDDNGNLIVANTQASIKVFTIYKGGKLTDETTITLPSAIGNSNFISAKGNFFSTTESGYVYIFASGTNTVKIVEIKNGVYVQTYT